METSGPANGTSARRFQTIGGIPLTASVHGSRYGGSRTGNITDMGVERQGI
ncbi:hypothetical protein BPY_13920 [Bifidobacterium psychraerophilum]